MKKNTTKNTNSDESDRSNSSEDSENSSESDSSDDYDERLNINPVKFFSIKELCYYKKIAKFFNNCTKDEIQTMIDIVNKKSTISLRVLDWFVTKYSKKKIDCSMKDLEIFDVRIGYKSQLKSYKKKYFDPFRRKKKFYFYFEKSKGSYIKTTLGQLNFFKWALANNVVFYVENNLKQITKEMNLDTKKEKEKKIKKKTKPTSKKLQKTKIKNDNDSGNIKINTISTVKTKEDEIQLTLTFD